MKKQFLMVRDTDQFIYGTVEQDHPDDGPIIPQGDCPIAGATLVAYEGAFSRAGRRDSEQAYLVDGAPQWVDLVTLDAAKAVAWARIKEARDAAEAGVFEFEGGLYDLNKQNVSGAALAALMAEIAGQPFSIEWTLADNTVRVLDAATVQALGRAMVVHIDKLHGIARSLRDKVSAATTPDQAYAVTWPTEGKE